MKGGYFYIEYSYTVYKTIKQFLILTNATKDSIIYDYKISLIYKLIDITKCHKRFTL